MSSGASSSPAAAETGSAEPEEGTDVVLPDCKVSCSEITPWAFTARGSLSPLSPESLRSLLSLSFVAVLGRSGAVWGGIGAVWGWYL